MSRTNIVIDDKLVKHCQKLTGIQTKKELVDYALHELLRHEEQANLLKLKGNINWQGNLRQSRMGRNKEIKK